MQSEKAVHPRKVVKKARAALELLFEKAACQQANRQRDDFFDSLQRLHGRFFVLTNV